MSAKLKWFSRFLANYFFFLPNYFINNHFLHDRSGLGNTCWAFYLSGVYNRWIISTFNGSEVEAYLGKVARYCKPAADSEWDCKALCMKLFLSYYICSWITCTALSYELYTFSLSPFLFLLDYSSCLKSSTESESMLRTSLCLCFVDGSCSQAACRAARAQGRTWPGFQEDKVQLWSSWE